MRSRFAALELQLVGIERRVHVLELRFVALERQLVTLELRFATFEFWFTTPKKRAGFWPGSGRLRDWTGSTFLGTSAPGDARSGDRQRLVDFGPVRHLREVRAFRRLTNCFWAGMLITPPIACSWQRRRPIANLAPFLRMTAEWLKLAEAPID
jgi:hypothetical protein